MVDIRTTFAGLELTSPIIVSSSGLGRSVDRLKAFVEHGAGAVVLKSLFEEQITLQTGHLLAQNDYPEAEDYIASYVRNETLEDYLSLIQRAKRELDVPVIASLNCYHADTWTDFAKQIAHAGADALEVNILRLETDLYYNPETVEEAYLDIVRALQPAALPLIIKLSRMHTNLPSLVDKLRATGATAVTLFNRPYQIDIDLEREQLVGGEVFSSPADFTETLRFTGLIRGLVPNIELSASSGIYTHKELIKVLLAGADTAQMCTALYKSGPEAITSALDGLRAWMREKGYRTLEELRGRLSYASIAEPNIFERQQFLKYFSQRTK